MAEQGAAPAVVPRKRNPGTPRVTVRPYYGGLPFSGLDGAGRREAKASRIRVGGAPRPVPEATVPGCEIAAAERWAVRVPRWGRNAARRD